jgi:hypothetical protein
VVVDKHSKGIDITEVTLFNIVSVADIIHGFSTSKDISNGVVHWVVEQSCEVILIGTHVGRVSVEALSHLEDAGGLTILLPEVAWHLWDGVNSDSIEAVLLDDTTNPALEVGADEIVVLVQIWQVGQSAILNLSLVIPVGDLAVSVEVIGRVEWVELAVVLADWTNVVGHNIDHHPDALGMGSFHELLQVVLGSKVGVDGFPVTSPVSVVSTIGVVHNWGDPNGIESHSLNVVKLLDHTLVITSAVARKVTTSRCASITSGKSIGEDLID